MRPLLRAVACAALFAGSVSAQTTHDVELIGFAFNSNFITIQTGDTVRWTWINGLHDVKSGALLTGVPDGVFDSGVPVNAPGLTFEVTFDAAFLAANPVPDDVYEYFCSVHWGFGMRGIVRVEDPTPGSFDLYGCGTNPVGSLSLISGTPTAGSSITIGVDNPIASQPSGVLALLAIATAPAPGFPCGLQVPGLGMVGPYGPGELLVSVAAPNPVLILGPQLWAGSGTPSEFAIGLPASASFVGLHFYFQGVIAEASGLFALTEAADVGIGS